MATFFQAQYGFWSKMKIYHFFFTLFAQKMCNIFFIKYPKNGISILRHHFTEMNNFIHFRWVLSPFLIRKLHFATLFEQVNVCLCSFFFVLFLERFRRLELKCARIISIANRLTHFQARWLNSVVSKHIESYSKSKENRDVKPLFFACFGDRHV